MTARFPTSIDSRPVCVVGGGTLGRRIALMLATRGGLVRIVDPANSNNVVSDDLTAKETADIAAYTNRMLSTANWSEIIR